MFQTTEEATAGMLIRGLYLELDRLGLSQEP